ncbi:MAG: archaemetzincin [Planctomycetota bacterium]|nr:archaemetzincin [Planctomycetota bacterium]
MGKFRVLLIVLFFPFATQIGRYGAVACSTVDGLWSAYKLPASDLEYRKSTESLRPLHEESKRPQPGEWRYSTIEPSQSFAQFALSDPTRITAARRIIYVQPIGDFSASQRLIIDHSAEFLGLYFCCDVDILPDVADEYIPAEARRIHPWTQQTQFLSPWVRDLYLKPRLPDDAVVLLGMTATDLWPGEDWNFVFGEASMKERVGIWSIARFGNPDDGVEAYHNCFRRTLKVASHETGHMFSMHHCLQFKCNMAGADSVEECDQHPLYLCPDCIAKLHWSIRPDPIDRFNSLAEFCGRNGLTNEQQYYQLAAKLIHSQGKIEDAK